MSALQTNINTLMNANSVEELKGRLVAILTAVADAPAGSGITTLTSTTLAVTGSGDSRNIESTSATFLPEILDNNGDATIEVVSGWYFRTGNVCTMSFLISLTIGAGSSETTFKFSLPIATEFVNQRQMIITSNMPTNMIELDGGSVTPDNLGLIRVKTADVEQEISNLQVNVSYLILE